MLAGQTLTKLYVWPHMTLCRKREQHCMRSLCLGDQHATLNLHLWGKYRVVFSLHDTGPEESSSSTIEASSSNRQIYRTTSLPRQTNSWKHNGYWKLDKQPQIVQSNPTPKSIHWLKRNLPRMFDKCLQNHGDCRKRRSPETIPHSESSSTVLGTSSTLVKKFFKI